MHTENSQRQELLDSLLDNSKLLYSSHEACLMLGVSLQVLRRAIEAGKIKTIPIGRLVKIPAQEIQRLVKDAEGVLEVKDAAKKLGISTEMMRILITTGKIKAYRLSDYGPFRVLNSEVERIAREGVSLKDEDNK